MPRDDERAGAAHDRVLGHAVGALEPDHDGETPSGRAAGLRK